ncbi:MAG TPA: hypothetical protein VMU49_00865 [Candidatus Acidoferrales bacterium]|nr:hypothetical protein [Candidatus Acidoferrales bacterium]
MLLFLNGEWWQATAMFGLAFAVAASAAVGLGWWVLRGERLNRQAASAHETTGDHPSH